MFFGREKSEAGRTGEEEELQCPVIVGKLLKSKRNKTRGNNNLFLVLD